ncbi:MltR family transcriptional regulator [Stutzerimonas nitrititolerans]|uniref:MltR family transcriptional regulator n=1 Tax=Stutzerimonas nitrititolerans TaxID=2482751 RepID=UPI00289E82EB|nr:MltR family transcriptional regulator [Stutzerimonas nitrititolerans]
MSNIPEAPNSSEIEDEVFGGINLLTKSLRELDDRGLVLSLAAFAEEALGELLKAFLMPSDATAQLIEGFNAPLGTFSSRIKAAYAIGLITKEQFLDLERLRKIRNEFAHSWKPVDISKPKVAALIDSMTYSRIDDHYPESLSEKIRSSMSCLLVEVRSSTHQILKKGMKAKLVGNHLMRGFSGDFYTQIQNAREELNRIVENLEGADKKKRNFYITQLLRYKDRLTVLERPKNPEQEKAITNLLEEFSSVLHRLSA